jgi:hypothetical protein
MCWADLGLIGRFSGLSPGECRASGELISIVIFGMISALFFGLIGGLTSEQIEETTYPGQRLKQSLLNSIFSLGIFGLIIGLIMWLISPYSGSITASPATWQSVWLDWGRFFGLSYEQSVGLSIGLMGALIVGPIGVLMVGLSKGLYLGYFPLIQHYSLRLVLTRYQFLPWPVIAFLEYSVGLIFLRRVGGGYIFIHRILMEHFAAMYTEGEK